MMKLQSRSKLVSSNLFVSTKILEASWGMWECCVREADLRFGKNSIQRDFKGISELWQKDRYGSEAVVD